MKKEDFFKTIYRPMDCDTVKLAQEMDPEEAAHVMKTAEDVKRHSFLFDMEWDMERTYEPEEFGQVVDWEYNPGDDPEFTWQFNRHRFLICLGQAYCMTGDESYVTCMIDLMQQFMESQSDVENKRQTTWRILEIGIRGANWIKALYLIRESAQLTETFLEKCYQCLRQHADIIMKEHNPYCYAGNWGVLENHGLYLLGALLPEEVGHIYRKQAIEVLDIALCMQVLPDGVQLEQSPMYHHEVLHCMLEVMYFAKLSGDALPESFVNQVYKLTLASMVLCKPNGKQLTMGDSDDMNVRPIYGLAAFVFEMYDAVETTDELAEQNCIVDTRRNMVDLARFAEDLKRRNYQYFKYIAHGNIGYDTIVLIGKQGVETYGNIVAKVPTFTNTQLYDGGHYVMRSSWEEDADMLHFDGGLLGTSHGHSDTLHVDLILNGQDVLVDSGRYTYVTKPERFEFKGTKAHNTILVDGKEFNEWNHSWFSKTVSAQSRQNLVIKDDCEFASAGHTGYMSLENPVWINRKVLHIAEDIYVFVDECYTSGKHCYTQYFHFDYQGKVCVKEQRVDEGNEKEHLYRQQVDFINGDAKARFFFDERSKVSLIQTHQSLHYNSMEMNQTVQCQSEGQGFHSRFTVCIKDVMTDDFVEKVPVKSFINQEVQPDEIVEGLKVRHGDKIYLIVMGHTEMKAPVTLYQIEDRMGCGNVIVFDTTRGQYEETVLNW